MAELDVGGVKLSGGKGLAAMMALGSLIGALYGGFEVYKDYMDMKEKLANLEPETIQQQIDLAMVKLDEGVSYARDIKDDLRSDVIAVEKALGEVENRIRATESENREMVKEAQRWFDERTASIDEKLTTLEERMDKKIQRALDNPLVGQ
jgi:hypothetical protein